MECPGCGERNEDRMVREYIGIIDYFGHCFSCGMWWGNDRVPFELDEDPVLKKIVSMGLIR